MKYLYILLLTVLALQCTPQNKVVTSGSDAIAFEVIHQSKLEMLGDNTSRILNSQQEIDYLYQFLNASPKGYGQIPIPAYDADETLITINATPKTKNDIKVISIVKNGDKLNIIAEDVENPQLKPESRWKSAIIIKLSGVYHNQTINFNVK